MPLCRTAATVADIQQQIADGARPRLARVGDRIEHGQPVPDNVVRARDAVGHIWGTERAELDIRQFARVPVSDWWPLTVVEVDPEPQPAEPEPVDLLELVRLYGHEGHESGFAATERDEEADDHHDGKARRLYDQIEAEVRALRAEAAGSMQVITERDDAHEWADRLAQAIAEFLHIDIGEHSNMNLPWQAALIALTDTVSPQPAESGPLVLTLPVVPDGAVALVGAVRYERGDGGHPRASWRHPSGALVTLGEVLDNEAADGDGSVTVEMAPPREPRTWPKLRLYEDIDLPLQVDLVRETGVERWVITADRRRYVRVGSPALTLAELCTLGEVREVLT